MAGFFAETEEGHAGGSARVCDLAVDRRQEQARVHLGTQRNSATPRALCLNEDPSRPFRRRDRVGCTARGWAHVLATYGCRPAGRSCDPTRTITQAIYEQVKKGRARWPDCVSSVYHRDCPRLHNFSLFSSRISAEGCSMPFGYIASTVGVWPNNAASNQGKGESRACRHRSAAHREGGGGPRKLPARWPRRRTIHLSKEGWLRGGMPEGRTMRLAGDRRTPAKQYAHLWRVWVREYNVFRMNCHCPD